MIGGHMMTASLIFLLATLSPATPAASELSQFERDLKKVVKELGIKRTAKGDGLSSRSSPAAEETIYSLSGETTYHQLAVAIEKVAALHRLIRLEKLWIQQLQERKGIPSVRIELRMSLRLSAPRLENNERHLRNAVALMDAISRALPSGTYFTELSFDGATIQMEAAGVLFDFAELLKDLKDSGAVAEINVLDVRNDPYDNMFKASAVYLAPRQASRAYKPEGRRDPFVELFRPRIDR
jgi:hypothetical protein